MSNNGFQQSGKIARKIAQMPSTTNSFINDHDAELNKKDSLPVPYHIIESQQSMKQLSRKMHNGYKWVVTSLKPEVGAQVIKARFKKMSNDRIQRMYDAKKIITFKTEGSYVTWIDIKAKER